MGTQSSKAHRHEPVYSLPQHDVNHLRGLYASLKQQHSCIDKQLFIQHLELPPILHHFGDKLFRAFIKAGNEASDHLPPDHHHHAAKATPAAGMTEHQFIVGVEKCCKGSISQQLRFLFAMYDDDSNAEAERKEQIKTMLCDCTFLAKTLYSHYWTTLDNSDTTEPADGTTQGDASSSTSTTTSSSSSSSSSSTARDLAGTLEVTGEDLHVWEKRAINPMLEGLLLYHEREAGGGQRTVAIDTFVAWTSDTVTHLFKSTVEVLVRQRFLECAYRGQQAAPVAVRPSQAGGGDISGASKAAPFHLPTIERVLNRKQQILDQARLWVLATVVNSQDRAVPWRVLYSTVSHGSSFNRFCAALFGYHGTTLLVIRTKAKAVFGVYNVSGWQDATSYFGDARSFLFSLYPRVNVYRTMGKGTNYVYLNTKKTFSELPIGIGFGGELGSFRLWIDKDFEVGATRSVDTTYRNGPLMEGYDFEIEDLVVWGLGGEDAEQRQEKERLREQNLTEKMRKVNRTMAAEGWKDGPNKWMMDLVGRTGASDPFVEDLKKDDKKSQPQL